MVENNSPKLSPKSSPKIPKKVACPYGKGCLLDDDCDHSNENPHILPICEQGGVCPHYKKMFIYANTTGSLEVSRESIKHVALHYHSPIITDPASKLYLLRPESPSTRVRFGSASPKRHSSPAGSPTRSSRFSLNLSTLLQGSPKRSPTRDVYPNKENAEIRKKKTS